MFLVCLIPVLGFAQTKVSILQADKLIGRTSTSGLIRVLIGDVKIKIQDNELRSDSALHFVDQNEIRAYGNVYIQGDEERIWADSAIYNSKTDLSFFYGNLVIERDSSRFFSRKSSYSFPQKTAYFPEKLQLEDEKGILTADRGIYFNDKDSASFRGNVQISDSTSYVEADSLLSNRSAERYELFGNVFARETEKNSFISSNYMYLDSTGQRRLRDNSVLIKIDSAKADTVIIWAKKIDYNEFSDSSYTFTAKDSVKIWSPKFSSYSDSAFYSSITELFKLESDAFTWNNRLQLSAPLILISARDDTVRNISAFPKPFAVQQDSVTNRFQQMSGDSLFALFDKGEIKTVTFFENAAVAFFSTNEEKQADGLMVVQSQNVILYFEKEDLVDMSALVNIKATYSEEAGGIEAYRLTGFVWKPELRPEKILLPSSTKKIPTKRAFSTYPKHHPLYQKK